MDPNPPQDQFQSQNKPEATPKQSVVARVQQAQNVLVTVKSDPSVDELAATIGMTLLLNKLGKHATAVFSGAVPSTLEFLKPEDTLENNTDSLRDFIVSLDKSKADKLRYKVEENVVKIFITPYRTSITQDDLEFTQGDFNVDVVLALGVTRREELDQAIMAHGRILHDATVVTITAGQDFSELGQINWQEAGASSLSEMLVSISEAFGGGLIDEQIATAFLTGIVSETERFSNPKTSPKVMTMAAQLMAAGANQQLIANELDKAIEVNLNQPTVPTDTAKPEGEQGDINISDDGSLTIAHNDSEPESPKSDEPPAVLPEPAPVEPEKPVEPLPPLEPLTPPSEHEIESFLPPVPVDQPEAVEPLMVDEPAQPAEPEHPADPTHESSQPGEQPPLPEPTLPLAPDQHQSDGNIHIDHEGNLTPRVLVEPKHRVIQPLPPAEPEAESQQPPDFEPPKMDMPMPETAAEAPAEHDMSKLPPLPELDLTPPGPIKDDTTILEIEESVNSPHLASVPPEGLDSARDAVNSALNQSDFDPAGSPRTDLNAMPLGAPPAPTSFDSYRLTDSAIDTPTLPVTDVTGNLPPDISTPAQDDQNQMPPPPVPPPMLPQ